MTTSYHVPVMLNASLKALNLDGDGGTQDGNWMDATFGGGGHSRAILNQLGTEGRLFGFDQDPDAAANALDDERFTLVAANFRFAPQFLRAHKGLPLDGLLADLGVSSHQFDVPERGFSLRHDGPLDMRMNPSTGEPASAWLTRAEVSEMTQVFRRYGELNRPDKLAHRIAAAREEGPLNTTHDLIRALSPSAPRGKENKFYAKVFQAIRIHINDELGALEDLLTQAVGMLKPGGRLAVMSYHSLEDRLVKHFMRSGNFDDDVKRDMKGQIQAPFHPLVRKAIVADEAEIQENPPRSKRAPSRGGTNRLDAMSWFGFLKRSSAAKPAPAGNRTLSQAELATREAQQEAQAAAAQAKAAKEAAASNPNRLRSSEAFREEQRDKKKKRRERRRDNQIGGLLREVLSGEILAREALVRQVPFLLFASFLTILYLALGYQTERILREKQRTLDRLEEATAEEKTLRSDLESQLQQSRLARSTAEMGLEQPSAPPILISTEE